MNKKLHLRALLLLFLSTCMLPVMAQEIFNVDGIYYSIIYDENYESTGEVEVTCENPDGATMGIPSISYCGDVVIPETITYEGETYTVTRIWGVAFYGNWSGWVTAGAFGDCNELTSIVLPSTIKEINWFAFKGCTGLTSFTCLATTPPELVLQGTSGSGIQHLPGRTFDSFCEQATLYVPASAVDTYKDADDWCVFSNIVGIAGETPNKGDVDGDGELSIADVVTLIDLVLSQDFTDVDLMTADVDSDGYIGIADVVALIDIIMGNS